MRNGQSVILETPCYYDGILNFGQEISAKYNASYKYIDCKIDCFSELTNRLLKRVRLETQIETTTEEIFERSKDKSKRPNSDQYNVIDTSKRIEEVLEEALLFIRN